MTTPNIPGAVLGATIPGTNIPAPVAPPLPPVKDDPAIVAGQTAQATYAEQLAAIRNDPMLSELAKAEKLAEVHTQHEATMRSLRDDLANRRTARLEYLQAVIPTGPGIPQTASQADRAVLSAAFRDAVERARAATFNQRTRMLAEAMKYGDETTMRAILTVAEESSEPGVLDQWAEATGNTATLAEIRALRTQLAGQDMAAHGWEYRAFRMPERRPPEVANLAILRKDAEDAARAQARRAHYR